MASPGVMARLRGYHEAGVPTHVRGQTVWIGHPGIKIRSGNGELTPAGAVYEDMVYRAGGRPETRLFHSGANPVIANAVERLTDRHGNNRILRRWNPAAADGHGAWSFTELGRRHHSRVRFDIEVPVYVNYIDEKTRRVRTYAEEDGRPAMLPMTDDYLIGDHALPGDMGVVRNVNTLQAQGHFIEEALRTHFAMELQHDDNVEVTTGERRLIFTHFLQSGLYYTYRPTGEFKINYQGVRFHDHAPPTVETVLGRTLHGVFNRLLRCFGHWILRKLLGRTMRGNACSISSSV